MPNFIREHKMAATPRRPKSELEKKLGYTFKDKAFLERALTHRSYRFEHAEVDYDNQRQEFLGDAVLGFLAANHLFAALPDAQEGDMTSFRSQATSGQALACLADRLGIGDVLLVGKGEERSGGRTRPSNLADAVEAVLAAVFLDGGMRAAERVFRKLFVPILESLNQPQHESNPKGCLQEHCQKEWHRGPHYDVVRAEGPAHDKRFEVRVSIQERVLASGEGRSKQEAEIAAARAALKALNQSASTE